MLTFLFWAFCCIVNVSLLCYNVLMYRGDFMPMPKNGRWTDARREARQKYDAKHYKTIGAKLRAADADAFRAACLAAGTTPSAVLSSYIMEYIGAGADPGQGQPDK